MENLWGMIEKVLPPRLTGRDPEAETRWDIMFVSDNGRVSRITDFKRHVLIVMATLLIAFITTLCFLILFAYEKQSVNALKESLTTAQATISSLVDENDELVARLVALQQKQGEQPAALAAVSPEAASPENNTAVDETPPAVNTADSEGLPAAADNAIISVENVSATMVADTNEIQIGFAVRKIDQQQQYVSGRTFVFLDNANDTSLRQVVPPVSIVDGRPTNISRGQFFSIARYKPMTMTARTDKDPEDFQKATILVFTPEGQLIYEKSFNITVRTVAPPIEPAVTRTRTSRETEVRSDTTETPQQNSTPPPTPDNTASTEEMQPTPEAATASPDNASATGSSKNMSSENAPPGNTTE